MGLSSSKTKTSTNQTTTPTVTEPYKTEFANYTNQIGDFLAMDPTQFVAPPSELQTQAFSDAQNLGGWQTYLNQAANYANQYASQPTTHVTATGYQAPTINGVQGPQAYSAQQTNIGQAPTVNLGGYNLPQLGNASQVGNFGYSAPQLGDAALANYQGLLGDPSRIKDFMADYQNPYTQQVIDATTAKFDEDAGRRQAELAAQGAMGGAFGGSRFGIAEGTLQGSLARERADLQARLLDEQYKTAAGLAGSDASAYNQFGLARGQMGLQTALSNQAAQNQFSLERAGLSERAGQFNASNALQSALANQQANNQFDLTRYGAGIDQARYGADASNQGQLANQNMLAQYAQTQFGADTQAAQQFASAMNQMSLAGYQGDLQTALTQAGMNADQARYYADALNQANMANANFTEQDYQRQLQAAGLLGDLSQQYGQQNLADLGMTADLGTLQRSLEAEYLNAYPTQLQLAGNLYSQLSPALYSGTNMTGTSTAKTSGGWLSGLLGSGLQAAASTYGGSGWTFSDRRLKSNIVKIGEKSGLNIYEYDIFGRRERGVMADEVAKSRPDALGPIVGGYATVNYALI